MSINNTDRKFGLSVLVGLLAAGTVATTSLAFAEDSGSSADADRVARSTHYPSDGRSADRNPAIAGVSEDEYGPIAKGGARSTTASKSGNGGAVTLQSFGYDFWIYDADVILFYDEDHDGFFTGIDLNFDVDTIYNSAEVYAAVYLSYEGGPWSEYAVSDDFTIHDTSGGDDYTLVTELVAGYPTGEYDLLIEIFDAYTGDFVAAIGPEDNSDLSYLPLEDFDRDKPAEVIVERQVTVTRGGGGSFGLLALLPLAGVALLRRRRNRA